MAKGRLKEAIELHQRRRHGERKEEASKLMRSNAQGIMPPQEAKLLREEKTQKHELKKAPLRKGREALQTLATLAVQTPHRPPLDLKVSPL
jgi:hypothetical protein